MTVTTRGIKNVNTTEIDLLDDNSISPVNDVGTFEFFSFWLRVAFVSTLRIGLNVIIERPGLLNHEQEVHSHSTLSQ